MVDSGQSYPNTVIYTVFQKSGPLFCYNFSKYGHILIKTVPLFFLGNILACQKALCVYFVERIVFCRAYS